MTRRYGRARRGQRVHDAAPKNSGRNVTVLGALSCCGLDAVMTIEGATDAHVFRAYVSQVLAPTLKPGDVVVMDNLAAHKVDGIRSTIEACGATLMYLPAYSPDYSLPSSRAGPNSRRACAPSRLAPATRLMRLLRMSSTQSVPPTQKAGLPIAAMPFSNLKSALSL